jgi:hypothetical protein
VDHLNKFCPAEEEIPNRLMNLWKKFYDKSKEVWERDFEKMRERDFLSTECLEVFIVGIDCRSLRFL